MITKQIKLINHNKDFREKLSIIYSKFDRCKKENEILKGNVSLVEKKLLAVSSNYTSLNETVIEM